MVNSFFIIACHHTSNNRTDLILPESVPKTRLAYLGRNPKQPIRCKAADAAYIAAKVV